MCILAAVGTRCAAIGRFRRKRPRFRTRAVAAMEWPSAASVQFGGTGVGWRYLILAKHSFNRSSSARTCDSMAPCNATEPLLNNSPEAFLSKFSLHSRSACLISLWACDVALTYVCMQASADEHVGHS